MICGLLLKIVTWMESGLIGTHTTSSYIYAGSVNTKFYILDASLKMVSPDIFAGVQDS